MKRIGFIQSSIFQVDVRVTCFATLFVKFVKSLPVLIFLLFDYIAVTSKKKIEEQVD